MRKPDTTGEYAIPNVEARALSRPDELPMDSDAFAGFYQRSAPGLRAYLTRVSGNHALAEDLVQESYLRFLCASRPALSPIHRRCGVRRSRVRLSPGTNIPVGTLWLSRAVRLLLARLGLRRGARYGRAQG